MVVGCFSDLLDVLGEGEVAVKENTKVTAMGEGERVVVLSMERRKSDSGGEGVWADGEI